MLSESSCQNSQANMTKVLPVYFQMQQESYLAYEKPLSGKQKCELCKQFMENSFCSFGQRCKFAHGLNELRTSDQANMKYKTKKCEMFKNKNYCIYGDRCNFIHFKNPKPIKSKHSEISKNLRRKFDIQLISLRSCRRASRLLEIL